MLRTLSTLAILSALTALTGCFDFAPPAEEEGRSLSLSFVELPDLGPDYVYEGWLIVDGAPVSTGRFTAGPAKQSFDFAFDEAHAAATTFVLTVEPAEGDDPAPSEVHILAGDLADDQAELSIAHGAALGTDFLASSGDYILETPTDTVADNYAQGVWMFGLDLPTLPAGWAYEGWVVVDGTPVSTGRFTALDAEDSDGAGPAAGSGEYPPVPGQDFIDPALNLVGGAVVISVEPEPDNAPGPFLLKPLIDGSVEDVGAGVAQDLEVQDTPLTGTVVIQ